MQCSSEATKNLNILLIGKTGNGKSTTGCTLLNDKKAFEFSGMQQSVTKYSRRKDCNYGDYKLCVVDTPGLCDTAVPRKEICKQISSSLLLSSQGYHVIFIVMKFGQRYTREEAKAIGHIEKLFGKDFFRFVIIVVTHANDYYEELERVGESATEQPDYFVKHSEKGFKALFEKCKGGLIFCENRGTDMENERKKMLDEVQTLVAQNNGECYTHELFAAAEAALKEDEKMKTIVRNDLEKMLNPDRYQKELDRAKANVTAERSSVTAKVDLSCVSPEELSKAFSNLPEDKQQIVIDNLSSEVQNKVGSACFPRDATCILANGDVLRMEHLQHGDKVQVLLPDGTLDYQEVFMFGHADPNTESSFLVFTTENQRQLSISPGHYLYVNGQGGKMAMVPARDVQIDDALYTYDPENGTMEFSAVNEIKMETLQGLYNLHTRSGTIIVNGVLASCYTEAFSPVWAHRLLQPVWFLYKMAPWINRIVAKDGMPLWLSFLDIGKSAWEKIGLSAWQ